MMDFMRGKIEPRDVEFGDLIAGERSLALGSEHLLSSLLVLGSVFLWSRAVRGRNESAAIPHSAAEVSDTAGGKGWESIAGPSRSCSVGEWQKRTSSKYEKVLMPILNRIRISIPPSISSAGTMRNSNGKHSAICGRLQRLCAMHSRQQVLT